MSLAIATLYVAAPRYECSLLLWCLSARRLSVLLEGRPLVIVGDNHTTAHHDCHGAEFVMPVETQPAVNNYLQDKRRISDSDRTLRSTLLKLHLFALVRFELVFFTDVRRSV